MTFNTIGVNNVCVGEDAFHSNTTGSGNTVCGGGAPYSNTEGSDNTALGLGSMSSNTIGTDNIAVGFGALASNIDGFENTAIGVLALLGNKSGTFNTAFGGDAGKSIITGSNNTALGYNAQATGAGNLFNITAIGYDALVLESNHVRIGNSEVTSIGGEVDWTTLSDGRFKKDIKEDVPGLIFIKALKPVTYNLNVSDLNKYLRGDQKQSDKITKPLNSLQNKEKDEQAVAEREKVRYTGFVAQDVEKAAKEIGYNFSGVDAPKSDRNVYGLRYGEFVVPLVKSCSGVFTAER